MRRRKDWREDVMVRDEYGRVVGTLAEIQEKNAALRRQIAIEIETENRQRRPQ